nr:retrovirus-related Pol polyprotein from transposon TNT 1-94 [Tanacetum cinerariifolium]
MIYDLTYINDPLHEDSTSQGSSSNVRQIHTPFEHFGRWTKDHPIANMIDDPSRSVFTRKQVQTDGMWCYFDAFLTSVEPNNFKQAIVEASWIDAMQEEIHEFERLQAKPTEKHLNAVKRIFRYLKGTINMDIWYSKDISMSLTAYADADYAGCQDTRRSTSGSAQFLGDKLVSWSSKKQRALRSRIPLYCDNKSAIALCCNNVQHSRAKHIDVQYHFIKERVENGIVELYFVRTEYQLADIFTKPLLRERFNFLIEKLGRRIMSP